MGCLSEPPKEEFEPEKEQIKMIWLEPSIDSEENLKKVEELKSSLNLTKIELFKKVDELIKYLKTIHFQKTNLIISEQIYSEFLERFKENLPNIFVIPKIIIFSNDKYNFIENNNNYNKEDNKFYHFGEVITNFNDIRESSILTPKTIKHQEVRERNFCDFEFQLTFEYIDSKDKLLLPILFKSLIDNTPNDILKKYTYSLFETYSKNNFQIKDLFEQIKLMQNIPIEILSKYYVKLYTAETPFYRRINEDLRLNKTIEH